jgi:hypothetical protein
LILVSKDLVHGIGTGSDFTSKLVLVLGPRLIFARYEVKPGVDEFDWYEAGIIA